jgi:hypothetical protein
MQWCFLYDPSEQSHNPFCDRFWLDHKHVKIKSMLDFSIVAGSWLFRRLLDIGGKEMSAIGTCQLEVLHIGLAKSELGCTISSLISHEDSWIRGACILHLPFEKATVRASGSLSRAWDWSPFSLQLGLFQGEKAGQWGVSEPTYIHLDSEKDLCSGECWDKVGAWEQG